MDIAGAQFDGFFEQIVDGAHNRRAAGKIAQAFDVVVADGAARALRRRQAPGIVLAEALLQRGFDVLKRTDLEHDIVAEHDLGRSNRGRVARIGDGDDVSAIGRAIRKDNISRRNRRENCRVSGCCASSSSARLTRGRSIKAATLRRRIHRPKVRSVPTACAASVPAATSRTGRCDRRCVAKICVRSKCRANSTAISEVIDFVPIRRRAAEVAGGLSRSRTSPRRDFILH